MKLIKELNEAKRLNFKNDVISYYNKKTYDPKQGFITGGGIYSNNWSREDIKKAVDEIQTSTEFKNVEKRMKFNSTAKELANGTLSFESDQPNMRGGRNHEGKSIIKVYLGGQIRSQTNSYFKNRSITRIKSPKPAMVAGDPVKSAVKTYKNALAAVAARYDKIQALKDKKSHNDMFVSLNEAILKMNDEVKVISGPYKGIVGYINRIYKTNEVPTHYEISFIDDDDDSYVKIEVNNVELMD